MLWSKQSTAATINVGPVLDSTGVEYTGLVIGDLTIRKHDGAGAAMAAAATLTHVDNGYYTLVTTAGNMDTLGRLQIRCNKSTYQMPVVELMVLPAATYDALVTNGTLANLDSIPTMAADVASAGAMAVILSSMVQQLGPGGYWRYNANALEEAPTGSAPTADENATAVWSYLKATAAGLATTKIGRWLYDILTAINAKTAQIGTASATVPMDRLTQGEITIVVGDDYHSDIENRKEFTSTESFADPSLATPWMGVGPEDGDYLILVMGTVISWDSGTGIVVVGFNIPATETIKLTPGDPYAYSWQITYASGKERTGGIGTCVAQRKWDT